ncbi:helix-turn-helix domain-containing protein [Thermoanaerobacterium sp. DL9XJH110]|uniref:helix-turn-helix domain-containing protein n=1 Tax=Thermoanaerobacterium sp. DL9XJH110 TaxID=3386643 RepID=UPI003BB6ABD3
MVKYGLGKRGSFYTGIKFKFFIPEGEFLNNFNKSKTARQLRIGRITLWRRLKRQENAR